MIINVYLPKEISTGEPREAFNKRFFNGIRYIVRTRRQGTMRTWYRPKMNIKKCCVMVIGCDDPFELDGIFREVRDSERYAFNVLRGTERYYPREASGDSH